MCDAELYVPWDLIFGLRVILECIFDGSIKDDKGVTGAQDRWCAKWTLQVSMEDNTGLSNSLILGPFGNSACACLPMRQPLHMPTFDFLSS
jgi:hypothetical protein